MSAIKGEQIYAHYSTPSPDVNPLFVMFRLSCLLDCCHDILWAENERTVRIMGCVDISVSAKVWEVLYASVFLEGEAREQALAACLPQGAERK